MICKRIIYVILFTFSLSSIGACAEETIKELKVGKSTKVNGSVIQINTSFLKKLKNKPTYTEFKKNYAEMIYLINLGHDDVIKVSLNILASLYTRSSFDDHGRVGTMARALSEREQTWDILRKMNPAKRMKVISYYKKNTIDYVGRGDFAEIRSYVLSKE